jgi:outer membrane protein assembly factor BamB
VAGEYLRKPTDELGPSEPRSQSGRLRALDFRSGTVEAEATIDSSFSVVAADHGHYVQRQRSDDGHRYSVVAFDRELTRRWQVDTGSQTGRSLATTAEGVLYVVDGELAELDAQTGDPRWTVGGWTDPPRGPDVLPDGVRGDAVTAPSTGRVYLDNTGTVYRVDRTSGAVRWRYQPTGREYTDVAALPDEAVVTARGASAVTILDVLDGATGDVRGEVRPRRGVADAAAVGGLLVVGTNDGLVGYDVSTVL